MPQTNLEHIIKHELQLIYPRCLYSHGQDDMISVESIRDLWNEDCDQGTKNGTD
jgi:hypothetical protein